VKAYASFFVLVAAWALLFAAFAWKLPNSFPTQANIETIARQTAIVGFAAIGMTYIIVRGAIDLSVGSVVAFVSVVIAWMIQVRHADGVTASLVGILAGCACGAVNGLMVTGLRVSPFIATLASMSVVRGLAKGLGNEQKIDVDKCPPWLKDILATLEPEQKWKLFPPGVWLLLAMAIAATWLLKSSVFGRNVVACGSNEDAAYLAGVPVKRNMLAVFLIGGFFIGLGGLMMFSRLTLGDPTVAQGLELDVIAAVVIGGASLTGGQGSVAGSLVGALIMSTIRAGSNQIGLPQWVQEIATGVIIVTAVTIDRLRAVKAGPAVN